MVGCAFDVEFVVVELISEFSGLPTDPIHNLHLYLTKCLEFKILIPVMHPFE